MIVVHTKGKSNPSDFLLRHSNTSTDEKQGVLAEDYVNFLTSHAVPKAMTLTEIQQATLEDVTLQSLADMIREGNFQETSHGELAQFSKVKHELTVNKEGNIILRDSRIVMPTSLRERAIALAHEGHQGLVKTKKLLREKVWFPGIDENVKQAIGKCIAYQANGPENWPDPLQMSPLPPEPWHMVHVNFCSPFPTGEYLFVVIDTYSRFPEVEILHSTSVKATIPEMDRIFSTHGIPRVIRSDNGTPFTSEEIKIYVQENGIDHQKITPLWPQANSEAEKFMKPLTKAIRSAHTEGKNWKRHLYQFLLNYRATPHSTTGFSPAKLFFGRKIFLKAPQIQTSPWSDRRFSRMMKGQRSK